MHVAEWIKAYSDCGFTPFPLQANSKYPLKGVSLDDVDHYTFKKNSNIGLFMGSPNGLVVLDADDESTKKVALTKFYEYGILSFLTIVKTPSRNGLHFWLKIFDVPGSAKAYYKLPAHVGKGELRLNRPSYVLAPGSVVPDGEYAFVQGGIEYFYNDQPGMPWQALSWCATPHVDRRKSVEESIAVPRRFIPNPGVLKLVRFLSGAGDIPFVDYHTGNIDHSKTYKSRSEAEYALVLGLIISGWSYDQIDECFRNSNSTHYLEQRNPDQYLERTYVSALKNMTYRKSPPRKRR